MSHFNKSSPKRTKDSCDATTFQQPLFSAANTLISYVAFQVLKQWARPRDNSSVYPRDTLCWKLKESKYLSQKNRSVRNYERLNTYSLRTVITT